MISAKIRVQVKEMCTSVVGYVCSYIMRYLSQGGNTHFTQRGVYITMSAQLTKDGSEHQVDYGKVDDGEEVLS